jgi:hypothetical protein
LLKVKNSLNEEKLQTAMSDIPVPIKRLPRRFDPARIMEIAFALVLVMVLGVVILGLVPISHPRLTQTVVSFMKRGGADSCAIGSVSVTLWKGISLHDVTVTGTIDRNHRFSLYAHSINGQGNLVLALLHRKQIIALIAGRDPDSAVGLRIDPLRAVPRLFRMVAESKYCKGLAVTKATIAATRGGKTLFRTTAMTFAVTPSLSENHLFSGTFSTDSLIVLNSSLLSQASGEFSSRDGLFDISKCKGKAFDGKVKLEARIDLPHDAVSAVSLSISNFDINKLYRMFDTSGGRLAGKADLKCTLDSSALQADSLRGKGTISATRFEVVNFPFQRSLVSMLAYPSLTHLRFKKFKTDFSIKPGLVVDNDAQGEGDSLNVKASGWVRADGQLNEKIECAIPKASVPGLPPFAQKTLEETPSGGRVIRFKLYGLINNPKFEIDSKVILQKAVRNMFDDVRNNLQQWLR